MGRRESQRLTGLNDYFHRFLHRNPFGHSALGIKAYYMGLTGLSWAQTSMCAMAACFLGGRTLKHHAFQDARDQADVFRTMLDEARVRHFGAPRI